MDVTLLFPEAEHPAIEERYAFRQCELLFRRNAPDAKLIRYAADAAAGRVVSNVTTEYVAVVTDPLIVLTDSAVAELISAAAEQQTDVAVAASGDAASQSHVAPSRLYLTLRQFEDVSKTTGASVASRAATWSGDPALFVARTASLRHKETPLRAALEGERVAIAPGAFIHRFASQRGQLRGDLLERIDHGARRILEFGCGEAALGAALKQRQECRVVGIELDAAAAVVARGRIDLVVEADVRGAIEGLEERFDTIIGGDIVEHLDDPWSFLASLRRVAEPRARLLLSLPNIAAWPIIADLLRGRFDYTYLGILCAGHLRFFTRRSIEQMLAMSGWRAVRIEPQESFVTEEFAQFREQLDRGSMRYDLDEIAAPGWYVTAELSGS